MKSYRDIPRPQQDLKAPHSEYAAIQNLIGSGGGEEALQRLDAIPADDESKQHWIAYLRGLAHFTLKRNEEGLRALEIPFQALSTHPHIARESDHFRLIARCLKKLGWYFRTQQAYEKAYAFHAIEFTLLETHGSFQELHAAAISLDLDAYYLKQPWLDAHWLQVSLSVAEHIEDPKARQEAFALSFNNLAGTYSELQRFPEAESAARDSLRYWTEFEGMEGIKTLWAYYGLADVFLNWGIRVQSQNPQLAGELKRKAQGAIDKAISLAHAQNLSAQDRHSLTEKQTAINADWTSPSGLQS